MQIRNATKTKVDVSEIKVPDQCTVSLLVLVEADVTL